jgi:tetratricopeptide (TPR) repeat protein
MRCLFLFAALLGLAVNASAQAPAAGVYEGMGDIHHPVTTKSAEAQRFFNQGLALIYAFNHDEAMRSFRAAVKLDPQMAMGYWGIALSVGPNYNDPSDPERMKVAYENSQKALSLAASASEAEQAYIRALAKRYSLDPKADIARAAQDYAGAMREVMRQYPDDPDAATLFADSMMNLRPWRLWNADGTPAPGTEEILATLENVIRRFPKHTGANHLYIHAVEASHRPERALPSADRLAGLAPGAGHLVHMPSHIYFRTGDFDAAARTNVLAAEADRKYLAVSKAEGMYPMMYYSHNMHFESYAHARAGRFADALKAAKQLEEHAASHARMMSMVEAFLPTTAYTLVRFRRWDEVMKLPEPPSDLLYARANWHYARGMALAARGDIAAAQKELEAMRALNQMLPENFIVAQNSGRTVMGIADDVLAAKIAMVGKRDFREANELLNKAVDTQDALIYIEPPEWYFPVREALGGAALFASHAVSSNQAAVQLAAVAEKVFRADLERNPRNGRSLFGLMESLKLQGKDHAAALVEAEFKEAWKTADTPLTLQDLLFPEDRPATATSAPCR